MGPVRIRHPPRILSDFFKYLKETVKQAFESQATEYVIALLFNKLPVAIQKDLIIGGKQDAAVIEIRNFFRRRYQYQQLIGTQNLQPSNEMSSGTDKNQKNCLTRDNQEQQRKLSGSQFHSDTKGYKALACRIKKKELAQNHNPHTESFEQRPQHTQTKLADQKLSYNPKPVNQICGHTGNSNLTCRHQNTNKSAYRIIPYQHQSPDENRGF